MDVAAIMLARLELEQRVEDRQGDVSLGRTLNALDALLGLPRRVANKPGSQSGVSL